MKMAREEFDIIVIGAGSGGLSVGLFMNQAGFKVLMVSRTDEEIGGDCLNDGCIPSKALIHVAKTAHQAREAVNFGLEVNGKIDIKKVVSYIRSKQTNIRKHENAKWLGDQGISVALGNASFAGKNQISVKGKIYSAKKIVIATGSKPRKLIVSGIEKVTYFDNESIFDLDTLPAKILCIGGGPIGLEMAQALSRLGSKVTVLSTSNGILEHDDLSVTSILKERLEIEGIDFILESKIEKFTTATEGVVKSAAGGFSTFTFDAIFVAIGRELNLAPLSLEKAGINVKDNQVIKDRYLRTTNKNVMLCGDVAGDLQFSHAAEFHARLIINNLFSPFKKKLDNKHLSWVTFTDPQVATFGLNEKQLKDQNMDYRKLHKSFKNDDRAVVDSYQYGEINLLIGEGGLLTKTKVLGGTMVAPNAGELIQELILANTEKLSVNAIFNKIYPYPVAARINQSLITDYKSEALTPLIKKLLQSAYQIFS